MMEFVVSPRANQMVAFLWQALVIIMVLSFQWAGAKQNAQDVVFVETQMVNTAQWVNENLPPDAVLGAHDIGAIGYFTQNPILDLAGLITPDVVPFIRDENRLDEYLNTANAEFLVSFPGWYPQLVAGHSRLFEAANAFYPYDDRMSVYYWNE